MNQQRILGRHVARELTQQELDAVSGSGGCMDTACNKGDGGGWVVDDYSMNDEIR